MTMHVTNDVVNCKIYICKGIDCIYKYLSN
jgi:hypothetical protein